MATTIHEIAATEPIVLARVAHDLTDRGYKVIGKPYEDSVGENTRYVLEVSAPFTGHAVIDAVCAQRGATYQGHYDNQ